MHQKVICPARVDLAGGLLDIWPLHTFLQDCFTINFSIPVFTSVELSCREGDKESKKINVRVSSPSNLYEKSFLNGESLLRDPAKELDLLKVHLEYWFGDKPFEVLAHNKKDKTAKKDKNIKKTLRDEHFIFKSAKGDREWDLVLESGSPVGGGLGASSALCMGLAQVFSSLCGCDLSLKELLFLCRDLEAGLLRAPAGIQDYIPAIEGGSVERGKNKNKSKSTGTGTGKSTGKSKSKSKSTGTGTGKSKGKNKNKHFIYFIEHSPLGPKWIKRPVPEEFFADHALLLDTGKSHHSGNSNVRIVQKALQQDSYILEGLRLLRDNALNMMKVCEAEDWPGLFAYVNQEQELRTRFFPGWLPLEKKGVIDLVKEAGAGAVKLCGAGGGGALFVLAKTKQAKQNIQKVCKRHSIPVIAGGL